MTTPPQLTPEVLAQLAEPFPPEAVGLLPKNVKEGNGRALALPHIDARAVQRRLDAVVPGQWSDAYRHIPGSNVAVICRLTVCGVTHEGIGEAKPGPGSDELYKSAESDALKRAAVKFGIGRYLYSLDKVWLRHDGKKFTQAYPFPDWAKPGKAEKDAPMPKPEDDQDEEVIGPPLAPDSPAVVAGKAPAPAAAPAKADGADAPISEAAAQELEGLISDVYSLGMAKEAIRKEAIRKEADKLGLPSGVALTTYTRRQAAALRSMLEREKRQRQAAKRKETAA